MLVHETNQPPTSFNDPGDATGQQLHQLWLDRADRLKPGDEFPLIDSFADLLGIRSWCT